jgi:hydrogenase-4 component B
MMTATDALLYAFLALVGGALLSLLAARARRAAGWIAFTATAGAGVLAAYAAAGVLRSGVPADARWAALPEYGSVLRTYVDGLSALFVCLIALISVLAALYSVRYMDHYREYSVARYYPSFLLFVAGMYGIVTTTDLMVFFCLFW